MFRAEPAELAGIKPIGQPFVQIDAEAGFAAVTFRVDPAAVASAVVSRPTSFRRVGAPRFDVAVNP